MQFLDAINVYCPLVATTTQTADSSMVIGAVLLSLVVIYLASKVGGELSNRLSLPPVLGELLGGSVDVSQVIYLIISASGFLLGAVVLGNIFNQTFVAIADQLKTRGELVIPAFIFAFAMAYLASVIHLEAILGAFAGGLVLEETDKRKELQKQVIPIADILVPIFFVTVGAKTDLGVLNPAIPSNREGLIMAIFLITVAIIGKVITGFSVFGQPQINRLAIGVGMIPRGEVGLVFAGVGAASGVLSKSLGAAIIMMVILTTFLAPHFYGSCFHKQITW